MIAAPPPRFAGLTIGWAIVGIALLAPWAWLVILDRQLRRTR